MLVKDGNLCGTRPWSDGGGGVSFHTTRSMTRLPKNRVVCTRVGETLLVQHHPELAPAAVDKALLAESSQATRVESKLTTLTKGVRSKKETLFHLCLQQ